MHPSFSHLWPAVALCLFVTLSPATAQNNIELIDLPVDRNSLQSTETAPLSDAEIKNALSPEAGVAADETPDSDSDSESDSDPEPVQDEIDALPDAATPSSEKKEGDESAINNEEDKDAEEETKEDEAEKEKEKETALPSPPLLIGTALKKEYIPSGQKPEGLALTQPWMTETGIPDPLERGLMYHFWYESHAETLIHLINQLKPNASTSTLRPMVIELLTSPTAPPVFDSTILWQQDIEMTKARMKALIRFGALDQAILLYHTLQQTGNTIPESIAQLGIDAMAMRGSADAACMETAFVTGSIRHKKWLKDRALCAVFWFEIEMAKEILHHIADDLDKENTQDKLFIDVLTAIKKNEPLRISASMPPLWRAILLARKGRVMPADVQSKDSVFVLSLAYNPYMAASGRLNAARNLAEKGMISAEKLREFYTIAEVAPATIEAVQAAPGKWWKNDHYLLYKAANASHDLDKKARILKAGLQKTKDKTSIKGTLWVDIIRQLTPNASAYDDLGETARTLLLANNYVEGAKNWLFKDVLEKDEENMYNDVRNVILENHFSDKALQDSVISSWVDWVMETYPDTGQHRAQKVLSVLHITKQRVPYTIWQKIGGMPKEENLDLSFLEAQQEDKNVSHIYNVKTLNKGGIYIAFLGYLGRFNLDDLSADQLYTLLKNFEENGLAGKIFKIGLEIHTENVL